MGCLVYFINLYKKRSPTVVRIVERRGGNCCCKGNAFLFLPTEIESFCLERHIFNIQYNHRYKELEAKL